MIPRIKELKTLDDYILYVVFDDGKAVECDVKEDMEQIESYRVLKEAYDYMLMDTGIMMMILEIGNGNILILQN